MPIKTIEPIAVSLPMVKPVTMAGEEVRRADNVLVRIVDNDGTVGWGEAASAPVMTGDTLRSRSSSAMVAGSTPWRSRRSKLAARLPSWEPLPTSR